MERDRFKQIESAATQIERAATQIEHAATQIERAATQIECAATQRTCEARVKGHSDAQSDQNDVMASIYERHPFYKGEKKWEDNDTLSEVYKLQSNNPQNKSHVEIHKDNDRYSIEFTVDKTIPEFNKGAEKCELTWVDSFKEFENVLQGQHRTAWKQTLHEHFPEPVHVTRPVPSMQDRNSSEKNCRASSVDAEQKEA